MRSTGLGLRRASTLLKLKKTKGACVFRGSLQSVAFGRGRQNLLRCGPCRRVVMMRQAQKIRTDEDSEDERRNVAV